MGGADAPASGIVAPVAQRKGARKITRGTATSTPDLTGLHKLEPSEEAKAHQASDVDAMGQDKRRQVVGHSYGPSTRSQVLFFVAVGAVMLLVVGGGLAAVAAFDVAPDEYADEAPWSAADAQPAPTRDPAGPCGEPGNPYPVPADSPCAIERTSEDQPPAPSTETTGSGTGREP